LNSVSNILGDAIMIRRAKIAQMCMGDSLIIIIAKRSVSWITRGDQWNLYRSSELTGSFRVNGLWWIWLICWGGVIFSSFGYLFIALLLLSLSGF